MIRVINEQSVLCNEIPLDKEKSLEDLLMLGWRLKVLINTHNVRGIGKTTALIKLAKKYNFIVVVGHPTVVKGLRQQHGYDKIYDQTNLILRKQNAVLIDESVNVNKLIKDMDCNIVTGFYSELFNQEIIKKEEQKLYSKEDTVQALKEEATVISDLRKKALDNKDYANYKLLINNFKQVIELINELEGIKIPQQINIEWNNSEYDNKYFQEIIENTLKAYKNSGINI